MSRPKGSKDTKKRPVKFMPKTDPMVGKKYGMLQVLSIAVPGKDPKLNVRCDCGKVKTARAHDVRYGRVVSCGCYQRKRTSERQCKPDNLSARKRLYNSYRKGAEARNIPFHLNMDQVVEIASNNCFYCDQEPSRIIKTVGGSIVTNGIDRVDNSIGYVIENCVPCCKKCNLNKRDVSRYIIEKAYEFFKKI